MKITSILSSILLVLLASSAAGAGPTKTITLKPSNPKQSWDVKLAKQASATFTVNIEQMGKVGGLLYRLKQGHPIGVSFNPQSGGNAWTGSMTGTSGTFTLVNTSGNDTTSTVTVTCLWEEVPPPPSPGGGGPGRPLKTIDGMATAKGQLTKNDLQWTFDITAQLADNTSLISWTAEVIGSDGNPKNFSITSIVPEITPNEGVTWTINPTTGTGTQITGTVKADAYSEGSLKATYTVDGTTSTSSSENLKFIEVTFDSMTVYEALGFNIYSLGGGNSILGGATKHYGQVKVNPASERGSVEIRLDQFLNTDCTFGGDSLPTYSYSGHDVPYARIAQNKGEKTPDLLYVEGEDLAGPGFQDAQWRMLAGYKTEKVAVDMRYNLYLQVQMSGATEWKTLALYEWALNGEASWDSTIGSQGWLKVEPGSKVNIGASPNTTPGNPAAPSSATW